MPATPLSAWDLGSTSFKFGNGRQVVRFPVACRITGPGRVRAPVGQWTVVLKRLASLSGGHEIGISCQRSTFLLWDARDGRPVTDVISWQDTTGSAFVRSHPGIARMLQERTGLRVNGHYAGPKLWSLLQRPGIRRLRDAGHLRYGDLACWALHVLGGHHVTGSGLAGRTLLFNIRDRSWDPDLMELFGVVPTMLPEISQSEMLLKLAGGTTVRTVLADQSAAWLALAPDSSALVNFGTGTFVLAPGESPRPDGYLATFLGAESFFPVSMAREGTVNGTGLVPGVTPGSALGEDDFAIPDGPGVGAPFWGSLRSGLKGPRSRWGPDHRQVFLEGVVFRVCRILEEFNVSGNIVIAGGLSRDPLIRQGLATLVPGRVFRAADDEASLTGALRSVGARCRGGGLTQLMPTAEGEALVRRYENWGRWITALRGSRCR